MFSKKIIASLATPEQAMNTYAASVIRSLGKNNVIELPVNDQK